MNELKINTMGNTKSSPGLLQGQNSREMLNPVQKIGNEKNKCKIGIGAMCIRVLEDGTAEIANSDGVEITPHQKWVMMKNVRRLQRMRLMKSQGSDIPESLFIRDYRI